MNAIKLLLNNLMNRLEKISHFSVIVSGILLFASVAIISFEVLVRKLFTYSIGGADELSSYILITASTWAFAYALFQKAHIRIDILYEKFSRKARSILDLIALLFLMIFTLPLTYFAYEVLHTSIRKASTANTPLQTPLWIPQLLWFAGLLGFCLVIGLFITSTIVHFLVNDLEALGRLSGVTTLEESIEVEESTE